MLEQVRESSEGLLYSQHLGFVLVEAETDRVVLQLPYAEHLGIGRVNGGAISSLVDTAATCAFWSNAEVGEQSRGATFGFWINLLRPVVAGELWAAAAGRRRGGTS
mgnify:CR=1 FL=1